MNKTLQELKEMSPEQLNTRSDDLRRELFSLHLHAITSGSKDSSRYKKLRRGIAQALTLLRQTGNGK